MRVVIPEGTETIRFQETEPEHAARLGVTRNYVRVRRRSLIEKLGGPSARDARGSDIPWRVKEASADELMATLAVSSLAELRETSRGERYVLLGPTEAGESPDLRHGRLIKALQGAGQTFGGQGRPRSKPAPPYGYRWDADGRIVPDDQAARTIVEAFRLVLEYSQGGAVPWSKVADELNRQRHTRKDGRSWTGDSVRDLTRTTTYAGYYRPWKSEGEIELRPEIDPLIPLDDFVCAAELGRGRGTEWLARLKAELGEG